MTQKPMPCGAVVGRSGRCTSPATKAYVGERWMRGKAVTFVVHRCDRHPLRHAISVSPIGQGELFAQEPAHEG